jgi:hydrogenase maturation protease
MKVLVAGIGNIFLGDDGYGVEVAARLRGVDVPDGVRVEDFGIRGVHLAYELLDGYDALVMVDAVPMGEPPGTVALIEPDAVGEIGEVAGSPGPAMDAHSMNPVVVLQMLAAMGGQVDRVVVVGCQPSVIDERMGLSPAVEAAVERGVDAVREVLAEWCVPNGERSPA